MKKLIACLTVASFFGVPCHGFATPHSSVEMTNGGDLVIRTAQGGTMVISPADRPMFESLFTTKTANPIQQPKQKTETARLEEETFETLASSSEIEQADAQTSEALDALMTATTEALLARHKIVLPLIKHYARIKAEKLKATITNNEQGKALTDDQLQCIDHGSKFLLSLYKIFPSAEVTESLKELAPIINDKDVSMAKDYIDLAQQFLTTTADASTQALSNCNKTNCTRTATKQALSEMPDQHYHVLPPQAAREYVERVYAVPIARRSSID